jgi:hypothetical protein
MTVLEATSGTYRSRVDGTIVLSVEISPIHAKQALELFGMPGTAMALAALKDGYKAVSDKPKGGPLAKLAGIWCNEPQFWEWLDTQSWAVDSEEGAAHAIREICKVSTRAELDNYAEPAQRFQKYIRGPYMIWLDK